MPNRISTVELSREQALRLGLIVCKCGHPPNNHHSHGERPCAHCDCTCLDEKVKRV